VDLREHFQGTFSGNNVERPHPVCNSDTSSLEPSTDSARQPTGSVAHFRSSRQQGDSESARPNAKPDAETERLLKTLKDNIDQLPELDATRIVRLHQRIMSDKYEIDSERLAEKLLELEQALNRSSKSEQD